MLRLRQALLRHLARVTSELRALLNTDKKIQRDYANNGARGIVYILISNLNGIYLRQSTHI